MIICPGSGYGRVGIKSEGDKIAEFIIPKGIAAVVLNYRLPNGNYDLPGKDSRITCT